MVLPKEEEDDEVAELLETCSSTLLPGLPLPLEMETVVAKDGPKETKGEEEREADSFVVEDNRNGSSLSMGFIVTPKPMEGLNEAGPPPFLRKTYEMVDDPETDSLVSWGSGESSFIVWDQHEFSKHLLPKYFKHGNFSSFIRQLNTYGFKKIDLERWEFANEWFRIGKRHLLKNIKRKARNNKRGQGSASVGDKRAASYESNDLEIQRTDQDTLRSEIIKLRQQEQDFCSKISAIEERIRCTESRQQNMFVFLDKAVKNPNYMDKVMGRRDKVMGRRKRSAAELGSGDAMTGNRNLLEISVPETALLPVKNTDQAFLEALPEPLEANQGQNGQDLLPEKFSGNCIDKSSYGYEAMSGDLVSQSTDTYEDGEEEEVGVDDNTIYLELDNLTEKHFGWGLGLESDLEEQTVGVLD